MSRILIADDQTDVIEALSSAPTVRVDTQRELYKDEVLDHLAYTSNVAQFVSFGPGASPEQRYSRIRGFLPNHTFETIEEAVGTADVLIAVIGKKWTSITGPGGNRRLDDPNDFLRLEIATALKRNIRVIPVLVGDAKMPSTNELPDDLTSLSRRQGLEVSDTRFHTDADRLLDSIKRILDLKAQEDEERKKEATAEAARKAKEEEEGQRKAKDERKRVEAEAARKAEEEEAKRQEEEEARAAEK